MDNRLRHFATCVSFITLVIYICPVLAVSQTFHFYRSTETGDWAQNNNLTWSSSTGNEGEISMENEITGPSPDKIESILAGFARDQVKRPEQRNSETSAGSQCKKDDMPNLFRNLSKHPGKFKSDLPKQLRSYKVSADKQDRRIVTIDDRLHHVYEKSKWDGSALFHKLLFDFIRHNKAMESSDLINKIDDDAETDIKKGQGIEAAAKHCHNQFLQHERPSGSWLEKMEMLYNFYRSGQHFLDMVFGTHCKWEIIIYHSTGRFMGFLFQYKGQRFLLLIENHESLLHPTRKRACATSLKDNPRHFSFSGSSPGTKSTSSLGSTAETAGSWPGAQGLDSGQKSIKDCISVTQPLLELVSIICLASFRN